MELLYRGSIVEPTGRWRVRHEVGYTSLDIEIKRITRLGVKTVIDRKGCWWKLDPGEFHMEADPEYTTEFVSEYFLSFLGDIQECNCLSKEEHG